MSESIEFDNLLLTGHALNMSIEEIEEILSTVNNWSPPDELSQSLMSFDEQNISESTLIYGSKIPTESPIEAGEEDILSFHIENDMLYFTADVGSSVFPHLLDLSEEALDGVTFHITSLNIEHKIGKRFEDTSVSVDGPNEVEFVGVRFISDDMSYILQEKQNRIREGRKSNGDSTIVITANAVGHLDRDNIAEFLENIRDQCVSDIAKVI